MSGVSYTVRGVLADGKGADFTALSAEMSSMVDESEPGTLAYLWYLSEDGTEFLLYERYADSESFLQHVGNIVPFMDRFSALGEIESISVFGDPTPEARAIFTKWQATLYASSAGFMRH